MDIWYFWQIVSAVMFANAFSVTFFLAAMKIIELQKRGIPDDRLPLKLYLFLIAPLAVAGVGIALVA
jgi:hypothetical protein